MQPSTLAKRLWLLLFLAVIAFYFYGLGHLPFVGPDEPRYAQVAREMFLRHDLITPTLGGRVWFEKPVLLYWMMILSFKLFGVSEMAARLGPALSGLLTITAVYWVGKRIELATPDSQIEGLGFCSSLVTASTAGIILFSRGASFDIVITMTITWALCFFLASELVGNDRRRHHLLLAAFYIFVGLSLLAKGLIGIVIPFGVVGGYCIFRRERPHRQLILSLVWGLPLTCAVAAIWYGPVIAKHGWSFIDQFFIQHHFARYLSNKYHHPGVIYFYPLVLVASFLPWSAFLLAGILKLQFRQWTAQSPLVKLRVFTFSWLLIPLVFFSFSQSKLPGYILPILPAAALIAGERLARFTLAEAGNWTMRITGAILLLLVTGGIVYAQQSQHFSLGCVLSITTPLLVAGSFAIFVARPRTLAMTLIIGATLAAFVTTLNCGAAKILARESTKNLFQLADARGYDSAPLYALHEIDRAAEFYAAGRVVYGKDGEPLRFECALQVAEAAKKIPGPILVVVPVEYVSQLTQLKSMRIDLIGDNGRLALVGVSAPMNSTVLRGIGLTAAHY